MNWLFLVYIKGFILILILGVEFTRTLLWFEERERTEEREIFILDNKV